MMRCIGANYDVSSFGDSVQEACFFWPILTGTTSFGGIRKLERIRKCV